MIITKLQLKNFRLFSERIFDFKDTATIIVGPNAVGKSSIVEAVRLASTGNSFRAQKIEEMIQFGQQLGRVRVKARSGMTKDGVRNTSLAGLDELELALLLTRGKVNGKRTRKRLYRVNGNKRRKKDFVGQLLTVIFRPEDMRLVEGSPNRRRDYFNAPLQLTDQFYDESLNKYRRALKRRNKLLSLIKEGEQSPSVLTYWDMSLVKHGEKLQKKRRQFFEFVNSRVKLPLNMKIKYQPSLISDKRIDNHRQAAMGAGYSLIGPHKDDFEILLDLNQPLSAKQVLAAEHEGKGDKPSNFRSLDAYGSRGQKRMGVLWLKKAELVYLKDQTQHKPVLLLDDILSELDQDSRQRVLDIIDGEQTIITTTDQDLITEIKQHFKETQVIRLENKT